MDDVKALLRQCEALRERAIRAERRATAAEYAASVVPPQPSLPDLPDLTDPRVIRQLLREAWRAKQAEFPGSSKRFRDAIRSAYQRGFRWHLTPDEYEALVAQPCALCGGSLGQGIGLDRLLSSGDYAPDNVRPCCGPCNVERGRRVLVD